MPNKTPWGPEHPKYPNCPVPPGTDCTLWFRGDLPKVTPAAHLYNWRHFDHSRDIIAYTDHSAPDQARELLAEAIVQFRAAVESMPFGHERIAAGHQFNAYESADNEEDDDPSDWEFSLSLGPITDHLTITRVEGEWRAKLLETALRVAMRSAYLKGAS